jgi:hypothetical protein
MKFFRKEISLTVLQILFHHDTTSDSHAISISVCRIHCAVVSSPLVLFCLIGDFLQNKRQELPVWSNLEEAGGCPVFKKS